jgi:branched-chain amino acid transport system substrate-binding protein
MIRYFRSPRAGTGFLLAVLVAALTLSGCDTPGASSAAAPIMIGGLFNVTGPMGGLDVEGNNGALLAAQEINAAGGVLGTTINLVVKDGKTDPTTIGQVTAELLKDHPAALIGFGDTDSVLISGPFAQRANVPFVTYGATSPRLPVTVGSTLFLACFGDNVQAAAGAEFMYNTLHARKVALVYDKGVEYTRLLAGYFKDSWTGLAGRDSILTEETYRYKDTDYSVQIQHIKALKTQPDVLYIAAMPLDIPVIVKQLREAGVTLPVVGGDGYDTPDLLKVGPAANNVYYSTHALVNAEQSSPALKSFTERYKAAYKTDPSAFSALGYDAMMLVSDAIKRAGSGDPVKVQKALEETTNFAGLTGSISFSASSHIPRKDVTMLAVKDGRLDLASELQPKVIPAP